MDEMELKYRQMTEPPVSKLICKLAVPCIISMLVTAFYNMADTYFVGMLKSNAATGAVGVVFSMMAIIQAVGFFFGQGSGNYISRELGKKNYQEASNMAATGFFSSLAAGVVICIVGQIFLEPLAYLLGSTPTILPYTEAYLRVILFGAPWMTSSLVLNNQLRFQGRANYAMVGIVSGAVLNIALDPLLIFVFDLGVAGAGWATIISQFVSFCLLLHGCSKGSNIRISIRNVKIKWHYYSMIIKGGLPSLARQSLASVATICLNHAAQPYGDAAIAAMSVVNRFSSLVMFVGLGIGQGFQPVASFNYQAKKYRRVKKGLLFTTIFGFCLLSVLASLGFIFAEPIVHLFQEHPEVRVIGVPALRYATVGILFLSLSVPVNMLYQSIRRAGIASLLSLLRSGAVFIPVLLILHSTLGLTGIQLAQPTADVITGLVSIPFMLYFIKTTPNDEDVLPDPPSEQNTEKETV